VASVIERMRSLFKRGELQLEAVELNELISQVNKLLTSELQAREMTLQVDVPPGLPLVHGDFIHLQQVIMNLILNSMDALEDMPDEKRNIIICASHAVDGMVELAVIDRGTGIPPEQLPHLFEPFFTTKTTGIGMGLAIARTIIETHGGKITAENNPQGGATVRFTIMTVQAEEV
jgi:signal transduction histidine kinase